jgi:hypothetical protein
LAKYARQLPPPNNNGGGGTITVQLIKGPSSSSVDPIAARRAAALHAKRISAETNSGGGYSNSSGAEETSDDGGNGRASSSLGGAAAATVVELKFPRLAKFVDTVSPPNFNSTLKDGRMYEEEVPKAKVRIDDRVFIDFLMLYEYFVCVFFGEIDVDDWMMRMMDAC